MRKIIFLLIPMTGLFLFFTCEEPAPAELTDKHESEDLTGVWQLYETGYSPGSGYVTDKVDQSPVQSVTLANDHQFSSNIEGFDSYKYYYLLDGMMGEKVIALFANEQNADNLELSDVEHSYTIKWEGENLKLHYRYCIEGCHMAFRKIKGDSKL